MEKYLLLLHGSSIDEFYETNTWPEVGTYAETKVRSKNAGGPPLNMGCVCASLGGNVKSLDYLSKDSDDSKFIVSVLDSYNIDTTNIQYGEAVNCKVVIFNTNDKRTMFVVHPKRPYYKIDDKIQNLLNNATYIYSMMHIINRSFENLDALLKAKENGAKIILDASSEFTEEWERNILLTLANGVFINLDDYHHLKAHLNKDPKEILFENGCEFICITDGANGSTCYSKDGEYKQDSIKTEVIDSTGAGDSFAGGFIYGLLQGYDYKKCLKIATACGSKNCTGQSGQAAAGSYEELKEYALKHGFELED